MTVEANAKINLTLEVYGRREDGYHELRSVVLPIALADVLTIDLANATDEELANAVAILQAEQRI